MTTKEEINNSEAYLATISKVEKDLEKIDPAIALLDKQPANSEVLAMVSAHQKQVVQSMFSINPENAIALTLAASIEAYGKQLEGIQVRTEGGTAVDEEINRIGDQVKMLQETLKYWLSVIRDEQLSIARNI